MGGELEGGTTADGRKIGNTDSLARRSGPSSFDTPSAPRKNAAPPIKPENNVVAPGVPDPGVTDTVDPPKKKKKKGATGLDRPTSNHTSY